MNIKSFRFFGNYVGFIVFLRSDVLFIFMRNIFIIIFEVFIYNYDINIFIFKF